MVPTSGRNVRSNGFEEAEGPSCDNIGSVIRDLEGDCDMGLRCQVVNLVGENGVEPATERGGVAEIGVVELHSGLVSVVRVDVDVINTLRIEVGRSTDQAVDFVAFVEEEFRKIGTVLSSNSGDQSDFPLRGGVTVSSGSGSGRVIFGGHRWIVRLMCRISKENEKKQLC